MYYIYYRNETDFFPLELRGKALEFGTEAEAIAYCEEYTRGDEPYNHADTPRNNHYRLEVYNGYPVIILEDGTAGELVDPVYTTQEFYANER